MNNVLSKNLGVVAPVPKGEYNAETYYEKLNLVTYNGSTYIAKQPSTGVLPTNTDYWQFTAGGVREEDIVNNLESSSTNKPLSAKQGNILNGRIENLASNYVIDEIEYSTLYNSNSKSTVNIFKIPHLDAKGNVIRLKHGLADDNNIPYATETPSSFSARNNATLCINASIFNMNFAHPEIDDDIYMGLLVHNGEILLDNRSDVTDTPILQKTYLLALDEEGLLHSYRNDTSSQTILNDGIVETFSGFFPIMQNGARYYDDFSNYWTQPTYVLTQDETPDYDKIYFNLIDNNYVGVMHLDAFENGVDYYDQKNKSNTPRQIICQNSTTKDIFILTSDGRGVTENLGLTLEMLITIAQYLGCDFAYSLDGGGSASTIYKNVKVNYDIDDKTPYSEITTGYGVSERKVVDFIYFSKEIENEEGKALNELYTKINQLQQKIRELELSKLATNGATIPIYVGENSDLNGFRFTKYNSTTGKFENRISVTFDNTSLYELGMAIYDVINNNTILRLYNNADDGISLWGNKLLTVFDSIPLLPNTEENPADINNLPNKTNVIRLQTNYNLANQPYTSEEAATYFLIQLGFGSYKTQIAIPLKGDTHASDIKVRGYTTTWSGWSFIGKSKSGSVRPTTFLQNGMTFFDTILMKPIWYYNGNWYDATGTQV